MRMNSGTRTNEDDNELRTLLLRTLFLIFTITLAVTSIIFAITCVDSKIATVGLSAIAGWSGLGAFLNLVCHVILDIISIIE